MDACRFRDDGACNINAEAQDLLDAGGPDVDIHGCNVGCTLTLRFALVVRGFGTYDAGYGLPGGCLHPDQVGRNIGRDPAADGDEFQHAVGSDAFDHEAYLIGMGIQQNHWFVLLVSGSNGR